MPVKTMVHTLHFEHDDIEVTLDLRVDRARRWFDRRVPGKWHVIPLVVVPGLVIAIRASIRRIPARA